MQLIASGPPSTSLLKSERTRFPRKSYASGLRTARAVDKSIVCRALVLVPAGDGSMDHLDDEVSPPQEISLSDGQFEVGREDSAQLPVRLPTVSARHAMLRVDGDRVTVTDLNSTNGTYIDGNELAPMKGEILSVGQEVIFGDMYLAKFSLEKR